MTKIHYPALDQMRTLVTDLHDWELTLRFSAFEKRLEAVQKAHPEPAAPTAHAERCHHCNHLIVWHSNGKCTRKGCTCTELKSAM